MEIEFQRAGQVGVTRSRRGELALRALGIAGVCAVAVFHILHRQRLFPIFPIAVFDTYGDGRADGLTVAHAGENVRRVFLNALASATTVAELAAMQFALNKVEVHAHACGESGDPGDQSLSVRFTGGDETQHV